MSTDISGSGVSVGFVAFGGPPPVTQVAAGGLPQVAALPHAGVGSFQESASVNFLLVGSVLMLIYVTISVLIRRASGRRVEVEDDGITSL